MATNSIEHSTSSSKLAASFAHVNFRNIPESYIASGDVECSYVVNKALEATSRDWVGIYKVGWRAASDYVYYDWSPLPADYAPGKEMTNCITFPGAKLPKDDGEFYQFCYVSSSGQVRGASTPFQFKLPMVDDFIEIEDENGELLVVRSKTAVLEEQLKKANEIRMELRQKLAILENEKALMSFTIRELEKKFMDEKNESVQLEIQLRESYERNSDLQQETKDLQVCVHSLQEKMEVINQEKLTMEKRLDDSDVYIVSLQEKIKNLVTEKDTLLGTRKTLEEEKDQCQRRAESSEKQHQLIMTECEQLSTRLNASETNRRALHAEISELKHVVEERNSKLQQHSQMSSATKECMDDLTETLHNAEDKLEAAEMCKKMLNDEVLALKQAYEKLSHDLEVSKAEADSTKCHLKQLESKSTKEIVAKQQELAELTSKLQQKEAEVAGLKVAVAELSRQVKETGKSDDGKAEYDAMVALQSALTTLKGRFQKLTRENADLAKNYEHLVRSVRQMETVDVGQKEEIASLKQRLMIGQEAYKEVYLHRQNLQSELDKHIRGTSAPRRSMDASTVASGAKHADQGELLQHMVEIQREMEKRNDKVKKYRHLYLEQRKKCDAMGYQLDQLLKTPSREASIDRETLNRFDPLATSESSPKLELTPPLKPLPPPIQPEILPSAKVAFIKAALGVAGDGGLDVVVVKLPGGGETVFDMNADFDPTPDDDKFVDAPGEPLVPCEDDEYTVVAIGDGNSGNAANCVEEIYLEPEAHDGYSCPVCHKIFPHGPQQEFLKFEEHVNAHFEDIVAH